MDYQAQSAPGPEGTVVTTVKALKDKPVVGLLKKVLPWVGLGLGLLLVAMVLRRFVAPVSGASVAYAPLADPNYGTATLSGIPYYDQYQAKYAPTAQAQAFAASPEALNLYSECRENCQGVVGCTDSSAYNYNPNATCGCINCCVPRTFGCLDPNAATYNPFANTNDNRFCKYATRSAPAKVAPAALDCAAQLQVNPEAAAAAGCIAPIGGCTDPKNSMYNPQATFNDGTCVTGGELAPAESVTAPIGQAVKAAQVAQAMPAPFDSGCLAPHDTQFLGGMKGCGDAWDLRKGYSRGPTMY